MIWASSSRAEAKTKQNNNSSDRAGVGEGTAGRGCSGGTEVQGGESGERGREGEEGKVKRAAGMHRGGNRGERDRAHV